MLRARSTRRRGRRGEQGQVLAAALILVFFFALLSVSTFQLASVTQVQHSQAAASAASHWPTDGAGLYGYVDGIRADQPAVCVTGSGGDITFHNSVLNSTDKLTYTTDGCNTVGGSGGGGGSGGKPPGRNCSLCVMNSGLSLSLDRGGLIAGEIDGNGSAQGKHSPICSSIHPVPACDGTGSIGMVDSAGSSGCCNPATHLIGSFTDPLAGAYSLPDPNLPAGTTNGSGVAQPGVWSNLTGKISKGVYVVTGGVTAITVTTQTGLPATPLSNFPVTIFLECPNGSSWKVCAPGGMGGTFPKDNSSPTIAFDGPTSGPYANLAVFADPNNANTIDFNQSEIDLVGTLEVPGMSVVDRGSGSNPSCGINLLNGRLIVGSISFQGSANADGGVSVGGSLPIAAPTNCNVYSDKLSATTPGATQGRTVVQTSLCGGNAIVSFDYSP